MPYAVRNCDATVFNGKIYVAGGLIANAVYSNRCCYFDPHTDTWTEIAQTDFDLCGLVLFKWKENVYAASADSMLRKYDHEGDTWIVVSK